MATPTFHPALFTDETIHEAIADVARAGRATRVAALDAQKKK